MKNRNKTTLKDYVTKIEGYFGMVYRHDKKGIDEMTRDMVVSFDKALVLFAERKYKSFKLDFDSLNYILCQTLVYSAFISIPTYGNQWTPEEDYKDILIRILSTVILNKYDEKMICNIDGMMIDFQFYVDDIVKDRDKPFINHDWKEADFKPNISFLNRILNICVSCKNEGYSERDVFNEVHDSLIDLCKEIAGNEL